jgi:hypothetical protein
MTELVEFAQALAGVLAGPLVEPTGILGRIETIVAQVRDQQNEIANQLDDRLRRIEAVLADLEKRVRQLEEDKP